MVILASVIVICLIVFLLFKFIPKINLSKIGSLMFILVIISSITLCVMKPVMHKRFSINVIEYLVKINDDGTMTTTKQTTTTVLEKKN